MSIFELDLDGERQRYETATSQPLLAHDVQPGAMHNVGYGAGMGLARGGAKAFKGLALASSVLPIMADAAIGGTDLQDAWFENVVDDAADTAVAHYTPNPKEVGMAGDIVGGLSEIVLPLVAGGGNPTLLAGSEAMNQGADLVDQGVDPYIGATVGTIQGASTMVGFRIPFLGKSLGGRLGYGVAGNVGLTIPTVTAQRAVLDLSGQDQAVVEQYNPLDPTTLAIDALAGAAFGGVAHVTAPKIRQSDGDATLTLSNAKHLQEDSAIGSPVDRVSSVAHFDAMTSAVDQMAKGESVNVSAKLQDANFIYDPNKTPEIPFLIDTVREQSPQSLPIDSRFVADTALETIDLNARRKLVYDAPELNAYAAHIEQKYGLPPGLLNAIKNAGEKSNSWQTSPAGATGVMQFMPENLRKFGVSDSTDPMEMIDAAGRYFQRTTDQYGGNIDAMIADYNGGPRQAKRVLNGQAPAAEETRNYLKRVQDYMGRDANSDKTFDTAQMRRHSGLSDDAVAVEQRFIDQIAREQYALFDKYSNLPETMNGKFINTDEFRMLSADYSESISSKARYANATHEPASFLAKQYFDAKLSTLDKGGSVFFTAGGAGSGKTSITKRNPAVTADVELAHMVYDGTFSHFDSSKAMVEKVLDAGGKADIVYTIRDPIKAFVDGVLPRVSRTGRTVPLNKFINSHIRSASTVKKLANHFRDNDNVSIRFVDNDRPGSPFVALDNIKKIDYNDLEHRLIDVVESKYGDTPDGIQPKLVAEMGRGIVSGRISERAPDSDRRGDRIDDGSGKEERISGNQRGTRENSSRAAVTTPEIKSAQDILLRDDIQITTEDGATISAREALIEADAEIARAQSDSAAYEAAVSCFLSRGN